MRWPQIVRFVAPIVGLFSCSIRHTTPIKEVT
jgi:hypothetical protein